MFANKENVNILTSLIKKSEIRNAVVCPGSRNAPIVNNLYNLDDIDCHPVTDERSAGFYALGLALATGQPVVVCVTSGSALLNVLPAVAEAYYQKVPMLVVSADRPVEWIGQNDGQTLPQADALHPFVVKSVSLPEPEDSIKRWHCNRLVNEALIAMRADNRPVHINVPISEPLFDFSVETLPDERLITLYPSSTDIPRLRQMAMDVFFSSAKPLVVIGQMEENIARSLPVDKLTEYAVVVSEPLSSCHGITNADEILSDCCTKEEDLAPDFILYIGGEIVSKRLKRFLRKTKGAKTWRVTDVLEVTDTFMNLDGIVQGRAEDVCSCLADGICHHETAQTEMFRIAWRQASQRWAHRNEIYVPDYSQMAAVREFERILSTLDNHTFYSFYSNSMPVRLACLYACHHIGCNRGVNGIEGCLSTAAGVSLNSSNTYCVIGDLSFFYDQNALWHRNLNGNLRILLLNNGGGGIFGRLEGLMKSDAYSLVAAKHECSARGVCMANGVAYRSAHDMETMLSGIEWLVKEQSDVPMLLEVMTDADEDNRVLDRYWKVEN